MERFLTASTDSLRYPPPPAEVTNTPRQDVGSIRVTGWLPTCLQVQRDPRLVDVRRVTLGPDPPDRSAVYLLLRGRRHVRPAGQRPLATGGTARDSASQQPLVHPPGKT
ncbi:hypothetical protein PFLUV_G00106540 [Perca fluviatilis]|uniref:Uncharacterized protein n=1 Tax=Perca fluviatilis TaxID=8168 RepID=A0A6A5F7Z3_PERFL|nr:hypothetical protein PFLUV_G00106540 [Perca fluviatilis]